MVRGGRTNLKGNTMTKRILLIGIGESGCNVVTQSLIQLRQLNNEVFGLTVDTDMESFSRGTANIAMVSDKTLGYELDSLNEEVANQLFPGAEDEISNGYWKTLRMDNGSGQWRSKAVASFYVYMSDAERKRRLEEKIDEFIGSGEAEGYAVFVVASLSGGTGSALMVPLTAFVKNYVVKRYGVKVYTEAYLVAPDVYTVNSAAEKAIKLNANAYATIRELNAINSVANGENADEVSFKLGSESDQNLGVIFDSEDEKLAISSAKPFDKAYIFERFPGTFSVMVNEHRISDILNFRCLHDEVFGLSNRDNTSGLFGGISLSTVTYPFDTIGRYVLEKSMRDVTDKWSELFDEINAVHVGSSRLSILNGTSGENDYFKAVNAVADRYVSEFENVQFTDDDYEQKIERFGQWKIEKPGEYVDALKDLLHSRINSRWQNEFYAVTKFCKVGLNEDTRFYNRKKMVTQYAKRLYDALNGYYNEVVHVLTEEGEDIARELFDRNNPLSVERNIICADGVRVDPVTSLVRLSYIAKTVFGSIFRDESILPTKADLKDEKNAGKIPPRHIRTDFAPRFATCRYARGENERFFRLVNKTKRSLGGSFNDAETVTSDMLVILKRVENAVYSDFYRIIFKAVSDRLNSYKAFFDGVRALKNKLNEDVNMLLAENAGACSSVVNVCAGEKEKNAAYDEYKLRIASGSEAEPFKDALSKAIKFFVKDHLAEEINAETVYTELQRVKGEVYGGFVETDFYRNYLKKSILCRLLGDNNGIPISKEAKQSRLRSAIAAYRPALEISSRVSHKHGRTEDDTIILFSPADYEYMKGESGDKNADTETKRVVFETGIYDAKIAFADVQPENVFYVFRIVDGLNAEDIAFFNEKESGSKGLKNSERAVELMSQYGTPIWNPYVLKTGATGLPLISCEARKNREIDIAKAYIYAEATGALSSAVGEDGNEVYACLLRRGMVRPERNGKQVGFGNSDELYLWLRLHSEAPAEWIQGYEKQYKAERERIPSSALDIDFNRTVSAVKRAGLIKNGFATAMLTAKRLEENGSAHFAEVLVLAATNLIKEYCLIGIGNVAAANREALKTVREMLDFDPDLSAWAEGIMSR